MENKNFWTDAENREMIVARESSGVQINKWTNATEKWTWTWRAAEALCHCGTPIWRLCCSLHEGAYVPLSWQPRPQRSRTFVEDHCGRSDALAQSRSLLLLFLFFWAILVCFLFLYIFCWPRFTPCLFTEVVESTRGSLKGWRGLVWGLFCRALQVQRRWRAAVVAAVRLMCCWGQRSGQVRCPRPTHRGERTLKEGTAFHRIFSYLKSIQICRNLMDIRHTDLTSVNCDKWPWKEAFNQEHLHFYMSKLIKQVSVTI